MLSETLLDTPVHIVACEDMILRKLLAGRVPDRVDAAAALRANHRTLDPGYLQQWAKRLELNNDLAEARREAFPNRSELT